MAKRKKTPTQPKETVGTKAQISKLADDFHHALAQGQEKNWVASINDLLARGADATVTTRHKQTLLHLAAEINEVKLIKRLLGKGVDPNARDTEGETPLHLAARQENIEVLDILLKAGGNPNAARDFKITVLHDAAGGDIKSVRLLLSSGAQVNARTDDGETPLFYAATFSKNPEIIALLLEKGAEVNEKNNDGETALCIAVEDNNFVTAQILIQKGADITLVDKNKNNLLHRAAELGGVEICNLLIESGIDPKLRNKDGKTPLDIAKDSGLRETIRVLETAPAVFASKKQRDIREANTKNMSRLDIVLPKNKRPK